jgi:hypothetical protein
MVRIALAAVVRKQGNSPSTSERLDIAQRRERLQSRMEAFHRHAASLWGPDSPDVSLYNPEDPEDLVPSDIEDDTDTIDNVFTSPWEDHVAVETQPLVLPSNLGLETCQAHGLSTFVKQEKCLRIGQANDALRGLRLGLSKKAVIFREGMRTAKTKTRKLRSWDHIHMVDVNVRYHAKVYGRARAAMLRLGPSDEELERYQALRKEHLNVTTARIDPSLRGQRDTSLAWFWTMDVKKDTDQIDSMTECKQPLNCFC